MCVGGRGCSDTQQLPRRTCFGRVTGVLASLLQVFKITLGGVAFDAFNVAEIKKVEDKS